MHTLLVIDANPQNNWYKVFKGCKGPDGEDIKVEQTEWRLLEAWTDEEGVHVTAHPSPEPILGTSQKYERSFIPSFVLVRNFVLGIHGESWLNTLLALRMGNVPSVNSLDSIFFSTQRALMIAELKKIQNRLGPDVFPLVPITYFPNTKNAVPWNKFPVVAKVGTSHAGYGKMRFKDEEFGDFSTLMAMYNGLRLFFPLRKMVDIPPHDHKLPTPPIKIPPLR
ncbi:Asparaginyl-tRNA synthetase, cytoplasmic (Asparagine--tRNA ligase) (AsnRS) [Balamuthia mandrillaris]